MNTPIPAFSTRRRVSIDVGGQIVTLICRTPSAADLSKFLNSRFETHRNKVKNRLYEARAEFIDKILVDVENATAETATGEFIPLNAQTPMDEENRKFWGSLLGTPVSSFRDLIPLSWKSSAAQRFEDPAPDEDEEKN